MKGIIHAKGDIDKRRCRNKVFRSFPESDCIWISVSLLSAVMDSAITHLAKHIAMLNWQFDILEVL